MNNNLMYQSKYSSFVPLNIKHPHLMHDQLSEYLSIDREKTGLDIEFHHITVSRILTTTGSHTVIYSLDTCESTFIDSIAIAIMDKSTISYRIQISMDEMLDDPIAKYKDNDFSYHGMLDDISSGLTDRISIST